jgi:CubicO group peptidase (beta-lactamase class C family)
VDQVLSSRIKVLGNKAVTLVSKDGQIIYKKEIGEDFKTETAEPIGTSSKWLTAALVMTFVDKGELNLDDPVSKYIPMFATYSKSFITIRHCLEEITGIESEPKKLAKMLQKKKFASLEEEVNYYASHKDIMVQPGQEFFYGDIGYNTVGRVLEVIAKKKTFSKLMQERITRPLGMKKTTFVRESGSEDPADGAISTAGDYIKFMTMLLNYGEFNGKKILSKEAILEMEKSQVASIPVKYSPKLTQGFKYGYGVWIQESDKAGNGSVISCPGINGTWPYIDRCRNYAAVILTRQQDNEQSPNVFMELKDEVERQIKGNCN